MLAKVLGKETQHVISTLTRQARKLPGKLYKVTDSESGQGDGRTVML